MRDPHVERLYFRIGHDEGTAYRNPATLSFENTLGKFETQSHIYVRGKSKPSRVRFLRSFKAKTSLGHSLCAVLRYVKPRRFLGAMIDG
jgi:hypothetical protein